jgi:hypothetical protein
VNENHPGAIFALARELFMGIFSWLGSRKREPGRHRATPDRDAEVADPDLPPSMVRTSYDDPKLEGMREAAAEDVAAVEEDDKYFGADSPANEEDML